MSLKRVMLTFAGLLLVLSWAASASAGTKKYFLDYHPGKSGGQIQIGGGLPLPIQLTDADGDGNPDWGASLTTAAGAVTITSAMPTPHGPGASVFPPLLIPARLNAYVEGTTTMTMGQQLQIPKYVLSRPAAQKTLGQFRQNNKLYAVGTNISWKWPAQAATLGQRTMTTTAFGATTTLPTNPPNTVYKQVNTGPVGGQSITYMNTVAAPFGGPARFLVSPHTGAGYFPSLALTVWAIAVRPTGNPPCDYFTNGACVAAVMKAQPSGSGAIGATPHAFVTTPGGTIGTPKYIAPVKAGASPPGTILWALPKAATGPPPAPTNMASSSGFPWTTGRITLRNPIATGVPEYFMLEGSDMRTAGGAGTIKLVAGSLSDRNQSGPNANRGWVQLVLSDSPFVPSMSDWGLGTLGVSLLAVGLFFAVRRSHRPEVGA